MPLSFICLSAIAIDGDTLRCANINAAGGRVRLAGIDAPELPGHCRKGRRCAPGDPIAAKAKLASLLVGPRGRYQVRCRQMDASPRRVGFQERDPYGRIVARCRANGKDFGTVLLRDGAVRPWG